MTTWLVRGRVRLDALTVCRAVQGRLQPLVDDDYYYYDDDDD